MTFKKPFRVKFIAMALSEQDYLKFSKLENLWLEHSKLDYSKLDFSNLDNSKLTPRLENEVGRCEVPRKSGKTSLSQTYHHVC